MTSESDKRRVMICKPTGKLVEFGRYAPAEAERQAARLRKWGMDARVEERTPAEAIGGT